MSVLLINADDAGLHPCIDKGISICIDAGVVNSVSVITNSPQVDFGLIRDWHLKGIRIGVHLAFIGVPWISKPYFFKDWKTFLFAYTTRGKEFWKETEQEARLQIQRLVENRISIAHLDSHQHVHHFPGLWQSAEQLTREFNIPRIRCARAINFAHIRMNAAGMVLQTLSQQRFGTQSLYFGGLKHSGRYTTRLLQAELDAYSTFNSEIIVHPGVNNAELNKQFISWNFDWEQETKAVMSLVKTNLLS